MSSEEMEAIFEREGRPVRVRPRFRSGISWRLGDAGDPGWLKPWACRILSWRTGSCAICIPTRRKPACAISRRLVKGGGYLFVSGVDLAVRSKVARDLGWRPVTELIGEIHEGDPSLRRDWPLQYWGLEPLDRGRDDWEIRYASVFQMPAPGEQAAACSPNSNFGTTTTSAGAAFHA